MKKVSVLILILLVVGNYGCERDDLCPESTQTTARLVIEAFDVSLPDDSKNIFGLRIEGINDNGEGNGVLENYNVVTSSELILPLRTDSDVTQYKLHRDYAIDDNDTPDDTSDDIITGNEDIITITYIRDDVFVSRACGFKTVFSNVQIRIDEDDVDNDEWIRSITTENDNQIVENEAEAHFILLH
ncbi:DUF6452 family protein [Hyunsoonleella pacifica]|uniref:Uncharacterized protein n=1 Tax=Hyunsoonleella pacifica TaxID=1080224 RepID=A0A4Q9FSL0_9FLAO|nr:DUF6452 family protein [Hyunsoonleella pacifica]TBN17846.1 hypothetical protein EYD46_05910 [Hyunsoonleella pacifica]GGD08458.1 hypothetical protein GCM10011368_07980 [Hyunsoonleella pacifica]